MTMPAQTQDAAAPRRSVKIPHLVAIGSVLACVVLALMPVPEGTTPAIMRTAAAVVLAIGLWSSAVLPAYYVALVFMLLAMLFAVAPAGVVFSGFASGAFWLVFGGLVISLAVRKTGLGGRLVETILRRVSLSYVSVIYGMFMVAVMLDFVIPAASARVTLLVPIAMALAERLGFAPGSKGFTGLVMAAATGTLCPAFALLPANVPNMALYGAVESAYGFGWTYGDYFILHFPVLALASILVYPPMICMLFRDTPKPSTAALPTGRWSRHEKILFALLIGALVLWMTDFAHGIAPPWVAVAVALILAAPKIGLMPPKALSQEIDYGACLFIAGIIGLGAVATHSGLGAEIARDLLAVVDLTPGEGARHLATMTGIAWVVNMLTTLPAGPAVLTPMAQAMAEASGWPINGVVLTQVASWAIFPLPYMAPPIVVSMALSGVRPGPVAKMLLCYMALGIVIILPLHYMWGRYIGVFL